MFPLLILMWPLKSLAVTESSELSADPFMNETVIEFVEASTATLSPTTTSVKRPRPMFGMDLHCPSVENAVSTCPKDTNWVYYSCCGGADMYCCEHIQTWLLSALAVVAVVLSLVLIGCCVRWCCSYKRKTQQSYSFDDK